MGHDHISVQHAFVMNRYDRHNGANHSMPEKSTLRIKTMSTRLLTYAERCSIHHAVRQQVAEAVRALAVTPGGHVGGGAETLEAAQKYAEEVRDDLAVGLDGRTTS